MKRAPDLPARFTIEHADDPSMKRFLAIGDDGSLLWAGPAYAISVFETEAKACGFRRYRMGSAAKNTVVVRHTIH